MSPPGPGGQMEFNYLLSALEESDGDTKSPNVQSAAKELENTLKNHIL